MTYEYDSEWAEEMAMEAYAEEQDDMDDIAMGRYDNPDGEMWAARQQAEIDNRREAEIEARWQSEEDGTPYIAPREQPMPVFDEDGNSDVPF